MQVKLPGKRAVHKDSKLEKDGGCIFEKDGIIYNCAFALCDLGCDMNQYVLVFSVSHIYWACVFQIVLWLKDFIIFSMQVMNYAVDYGA